VWGKARLFGLSFLAWRGFLRPDSARYHPLPESFLEWSLIVSQLHEDHGKQLTSFLPGRRNRLARQKRRRAFFRPLLEPLESRRLLATYLVTNTDDAGVGSFRQGILDTNASPRADEK
jgi:hypothetical protein